MSKIKTRYRSIDGLSIRYAQSEGSQPREALLLSPWPQSLYAYDATWSRLAQHAHLTAVDLPGFGHSEMRKDLLSPQAMGEFIVKIADAFGLVKPHVVGPDIGTSAALFAAAKHPDRFQSVVVGSGGTAVPLKLGNPLHDWVFDGDDARHRSLPPKAVVNVALDTIRNYVLPDEVREDYLAAYQGERFADQLPYVRAYVPELPILAGLLGGIETPVHVVAGLNDPVVPEENATYLNDRLPNSKLTVIEQGHFIWEENAAAYADAITQWWAEN